VFVQEGPLAGGSNVLFELGRTVATPAALRLLQEQGESPAEFLDRHASGDWGDVTREDDLANFRSVKEGTRILSAYRVSDTARVWVLTEADRSVTTILLPEEY